MWEQYGQDGLAMCSRYEHLKTTLDRLLEEMHLGLVRYDAHLRDTFNALEFITTKQALGKLETKTRGSAGWRRGFTNQPRTASAWQGRRQHRRLQTLYSYFHKATRRAKVIVIIGYAFHDKRANHEITEASRMTGSLIDAANSCCDRAAARRSSRSRSSESRQPLL
jgi:hypothetical protein